MVFVPGRGWRLFGRSLLSRGAFVSRLSGLQYRYTSTYMLCEVHNDVTAPPAGDGTVANPHAT